MGRTYIVEETVGQYLSNLNLQGKSFVSGLLIGQCSSQKDYVVLATRTPPREEKNENLRPPGDKLDDVDEEWATEHAKQVVTLSPVWFGLCLLTDSVKALYPQITGLGLQSAHS
ncbi:odr-4 GPCR localization factor-like protein [Phyllostomus discolor]|uniref:Protein odr-4 homolog n=1 Tax=Phyllostomus discolor TaxID=89673 RepID=A0A834D9G1_9CHIR|nr:odr-4 GPCR localization factor-like protein [Phyllostomus discolor]